MPDAHPLHQAYSDALAEALKSGTPAVIPVGETVLCDFCDADMTADPRSGGFMFQSKAVGPCCAFRREESIRGYGEERFIGARCPDDVSFADWVRGMRSPDAAITITPRPAGDAT